MTYRVQNTGQLDWHVIVAVLVQVLFVLLSQFLLKGLSLAAARFLHNSMLRQLLR
jgi:hypothetical protein